MSSRVLGLPALGQRCLSTSSSASYGAVGEGARTFDAKNPLAYIPKGTRPPGAAPVQAAAQAASNTWLLHPWLPIDVRIPIVLGVGLASGYVYLSTSGQLQEFEDKWKQAGLPTELPKSLPELKLPDSLPSLDSVKESLANLKLPSAASLPALPALPALPPWLSGTQQPAAPPAVTETGFSMTPEAGTLGKNDGARPCCSMLAALPAHRAQPAPSDRAAAQVQPCSAQSATWARRHAVPTTLVVERAAPCCFVRGAVPGTPAFWTWASVGAAFCPACCPSTAPHTQAATHSLTERGSAC